MTFTNSRIYVAGHGGLAGSAMVRALRAANASQIITRTHAELDLTDAAATRAFFQDQRPEYVIVAAAKVGGILANFERPAEFIRENLAIETNVVHEAWRAGVKRLLLLGSSCIYPRECPQPMKESYLLTGPLEATNRPYALAKIAGIEMCWSYNRQYGTRYIAPMPTNLYGPNDNFDLHNSHVLPALLRKFHEAKVNGDSTVTVWGTGKVRREFLHADDMASACLFLMSLPDPVYDGLALGDQPPMVNVGWGTDITVRELAEMVASVAGFSGELVFDSSKPDGTPRKLLDITWLRNAGWRPSIALQEGLKSTYQWYCDDLQRRASDAASKAQLTAR